MAMLERVRTGMTCRIPPPDCDTFGHWTEFLHLDNVKLCVAFIERAENGRVGLSRENDGGTCLTDDSCRAMIGERGFCPCDDLAPVGK
jgi:hypothetical protein